MSMATAMPGDQNVYVADAKGGKGGSNCLAHGIKGVMVQLQGGGSQGNRAYPTGNLHRVHACELEADRSAQGLYLPVALVGK